MTQCTFHPNETAVTKCERCSRFICVMDKKILRVMRSSGTGNSSSSYSDRYELCPICYYDNQVNSLKIFGKMIYVIIPFLSLFIVGAIFIFASIIKNIGDEGGFPVIVIILFELPFLIIPSIMMYLVIKSAKSAPAKADQMRKEKQEFINSLDDIPEGIELLSSIESGHKWSNTNLHCFQCGGAINLKQSFCPSCGDTTKDEKNFMKNN